MDIQRILMEIYFSLPIFQFFRLERSTLSQTTKVFLAFTKKNYLPFLLQVRHSTLIDWLTFEGEQL